MKRLWLIPALICSLSAATLSAETWTFGPFEYDGAGNVKVISPSDSFKYDEFGRISFGTAGPTRYQSYEYDRFGNLTAITTEQNRLELGVNGATNQLTDTSKPAHAQYDAAGRMTRMTSVDPGGGFTWDALSMTKESTVDSVRKIHLYTASNERIVTITMAGSVESSSNWTLRDSAHRVLRRLERTGGAWKWKQDYIYRDGQLLASEVDTSSGRLHFHPDHLGTARLITGNGGVEVSRHTYYPFGREIPETRLLDSERLKFTGHERDIGASPATDLDYMHARYYSPIWGRFLSPDATTGVRGLPQTWNKYNYANNNPLLLEDPDGRWATKRKFGVGGPVHQKSIQRVLGSKLSPHAIDVLQKQQLVMDELQRPDQSFLHAMSDGVAKQSPAEARRLANSYVHRAIREARKAQALGKTDLALQWVGNAMHVMQDNTSPEHAGFKPWRGLGMGHLSEAIAHSKAEDYDPGAGSSLDHATLQVWNWFSGAEMPADVFATEEEKKNKSARCWQCPTQIFGITLP